MHSMNDHYSYLGVDMNAPAETIADAVDRLAHRADVLTRSSPEQAQQLWDRVHQIRHDLLSGSQRRAEYNRRLLEARAAGGQEDTVVAPLPGAARRPPPQAQPPPQAPPPPREYTRVMPVEEEPRVTRTVPAQSNMRWLLPLAILAALLLGILGTVLATRVLGQHSGTAASATATPTVAPTATQPPPTATTAPATAPAVAPTSARAPTTAPQPTRAIPATAPPRVDPVAVDTARISSLGYTANGTGVQTSDGSGGTLYAWIGTCTGSADGHCQKVFFFDGTRYLGTDTLNDSAAINSVSNAGAQTIAVTYANYAPNDPLCCPSGKPVTITYYWNGTKLTPSGTPPGHKP